MKIRGADAIPSFSDTGSGLTMGKNATGSVLKGMEIAGADKKFYPSQGKIQSNTKLYFLVRSKNLLLSAMPGPIIRMAITYLTKKVFPLSPFGQITGLKLPGI